MSKNRLGTSARSSIVALALGLGVLGVGCVGPFAQHAATEQSGTGKHKAAAAASTEKQGHAGKKDKTAGKQASPNATSTTGG
jgi:hypothetical protein